MFCKYYAVIDFCGEQVEIESETSIHGVTVKISQCKAENMWNVIKKVANNWKF